MQNDINNGYGSDTPSAEYRKVYEDTLYFIEGIASEYDYYPSITQMLKNGDISIGIKKRTVTKLIDEIWVQTLEEALPSLDRAIRNPSRFIEESEKILPIELSHNISSRSIAHLAQHTDYISSVDGDNITPSKILNVFHDETMMTYENKFLNTLIVRLFTFVSKRYNALVTNGVENDTELCFSGDFKHGRFAGKMNFNIVISDSRKITEDDENKPLVDRVARLYAITGGYTSCEFAKTMGKNYVRPPIMRTNAILKNKDLRQCLALWDFIEGCDSLGYDVRAEERAEKPDDEYINELYSAFALQYLVFRYKTDNEAPENIIARTANNAFSPKFITDLKPFDADDLNKVVPERYIPVSYGKNTPRIPLAELKKINNEIDLAFAVELAYDRLKEEQKRQRKLAKEQKKLEKEKAMETVTEETVSKETAVLTERPNKKLSRKRKKRIRRKAETLAEENGDSLSRIFNYDEYMRYIENGEDKER